MLIAPAAEEPAIKALAPKITCRPELKVIVPETALTVDVMVMSPVLVAEVRDMLPPPVLIPPLIVNARPELIVIVPKAELIGAPIVISLVAPTEVMLTFPNPPAAIAPLPPMVPADAAKVILPAVFVVIPSVVIFPVLAVNEKLTPVNTTLLRSVVNTPGAIVYAVNPIPALKLIACTVLTFAVTVKPVIVPVPLPCNKSTSSFTAALSVKVDAIPLYAINICDVPLPPMFPEDADKLTCPP
jgi:hypothetical protein